VCEQTAQLVGVCCVSRAPTICRKWQNWSHAVEIHDVWHIHSVSLTPLWDSATDINIFQ